MTGGQANFLQALGWAVLNSLWQMAILWVIFQVITAVSRKTNPSFKSWLAASLLVSGFGWFLYTFINAVSVAPSKSAVISPAIIGAEGNEEINTWMMQALPVASALYLILLIIPVLHFIRNYRYVGVIRRYGLTKIDVNWRMFVKKVAGRMGIRDKVQIWVSEFVSSPVTIGFLKPVILVPLAAINHLSPQQLEAVILHELSHIRRYDYLVNLVINLIQAILYFNPFVKALVKTVEREREKSCDEMVLQFQYDSYEYASALLTLEKVNHEQRLLALASGGKRNDLMHRVETIMGVQKEPILSFNKLAGIVAGVLCIIAFNALLIINKPAAAGKPASYAHLSSPLSSLTGATYETPAPPAIDEKQAAPVVNHIAGSNTTKAGSEIAEEINIREDEVPVNEYINVNYAQAAAAELNKYQEQQVKETMEASRKVLENAQWKALEKNIADVFTEKEKAELKSSYRKEVSRFDWDKWENNLRMAYSKVDWEKVNYQLDNAIKQITIDSLHKVYNDVVVKLNGVKKELAAEGMNGIPDTDISLKEVEKARKEALKALNNLKVSRNKKIAHL